MARVHDGPAQVARDVVDRQDLAASLLVELAGHLDERVVHQVLGLGVVTGEQEGQAHQRRAVLAVERAHGVELAVRRPGIVSSLHIP